MKRLHGFTLAEVLIAMAILGVIAALTLPALLTNINKHQWTTSLKTNKSMVERAFAQMLAENNVDSLELTPLWEDLTKSNDILKTVFKVDKTGTGKLSKEIHQIDGSSDFTGINTYESYALPNGSFLYFDFHSANPGEVYADVYVDVNGAKRPNTLGKDIFAFGLTENARLLPYGSDELNEKNNTKYLKWDTEEGCKGDLSKIKDGRCCTARVIEKDYDMDY